MLAAALSNDHRGRQVMFGTTQGGTIEHVEHRIRGRFDNRGGNKIDTKMLLTTPWGMKQIVVDPRVEVRLGEWA